MEAARREGLRVRALDPWYDVDLPEDLLRLERALAAASDAVAPRTREALRDAACPGGRGGGYTRPQDAGPRGAARDRKE
jgi:hypothetical protein